MKNSCPQRDCCLSADRKSCRMYRVNEIFYSLQGEGFWTGTPMVFVRLSGCNLACPFCDTNHRPFREMSAQEIADEAQRRDREAGKGCAHVCITGGEPLLQLEGELVSALHRYGYSIHIETNGTRPVPEGIDWVTLSPKEDVVGAVGKVALEKADEVKLVYDGTLSEERLDYWANFPARWHFLQPCDSGDPRKNRTLMEQTIGHILSHGIQWRLSLQTHKLLGIR